MKIKFKHFTLLIAALLMVGFSSCSSDDVDNTTPGVEENGTKTVFLQINNGPTTYAEGASKVAGAVNFKNGDLYFVTAAGAIMKHYTITDADTDIANTVPGKNIKMSDIVKPNLGEGISISGLPGNITQVYIVGNYTTTATTTVPALNTSGSIKGINKHVLKVENQGAFDLVNLYGTAPLVQKNDGVAGIDFTASVELKPTVSRIELTELKGDMNIVSFEVEGVFVDNYYSEGNVDGTVVGGSIKDWKDASSSANGVFSNNTEGFYPDVLKPTIYDWYTTPFASTIDEADEKPSTKPAGVWGYNLFAQGGTVSAVPRIVIRLKNVKAKPETGVTFSDPQFLTIKGFTNGSTAVTKLEPGHIYKIDPVVFHGVDLGTVPNMKPINVNVNITLANWVVTSLKPIL